MPVGLRCSPRCQDATKPYAATRLRLRVLTVQVRNWSLYYDEGDDVLPTDRYPAAFAGWALPRVHRFCREVWREIR